METGVTSAIPIPDAVPLAAPPALVWALLILTFFLHLIPMNLVLGGSLILGLTRFRSREGVPAAAVSEAVRWMPVLVAAAVTFGVAPLLFLQVLFGRLLYSSSILIGWFWWGVIPILILSYYATYYVAFKGGSEPRRSAVVGLGAALGFIFIGFVFSNNMSLMLRPDTFLAAYLSDPSGWNLNGGDYTLIPRFLHIFLGALAVSGLGLACFGLLRWGRSNAVGRWCCDRGMRWFLGATVANFIVGAWFLLSYDGEVLKAFMRQGSLGVGALIGGIILGLVALGAVFLASQRENPGAGLVVGAVALVLSLITMILVRDQIRVSALSNVYRTVSWVEPQWGSIGIFVLLLLVAVAAVVWMARILARSSAERAPLYTWKSQ